MMPPRPPFRGPPRRRGRRGGKREPRSTIRCWCGRLGMVPHHAPQFRCVRRCVPRAKPSEKWSVWSGEPLTESQEFKDFVARRRAAREQRKAGGA